MVYMGILMVEMVGYNVYDDFSGYGGCDGFNGNGAYIGYSVGWLVAYDVFLMVVMVMMVGWLYWLF